MSIFRNPMTPSPQPSPPVRWKNRCLSEHGNHFSPSHMICEYFSIRSKFVLFFYLEFQICISQSFGTGKKELGQIVSYSNIMGSEIGGQLGVRKISEAVFRVSAVALPFFAEVRFAQLPHSSSRPFRAKIHHPF